ncbi:hypothetical protein COCNU_scaffold001648G000010 [Cocos nucifera]|nr:hypothetical protein [Cocos nucifera]
MCSTRLGHYVTICMDSIKDARLELAKAREKAKASQKVAKVTDAEAKSLKEALEKAEAKRVKAKANRVLERKRRKMTEAKVAKVEKKIESQIFEDGHLAVEAFKASSEFSKIKVEFSEEANEARQEVHLVALMRDASRAKKKSAGAEQKLLKMKRSYEEALAKIKHLRSGI